MFSTGSMLGGAADKFKMVSRRPAQRDRQQASMQLLGSLVGCGQALLQAAQPCCHVHSCVAHSKAAASMPVTCFSVYSSLVLV
jgi:hypothetical protein